MKKILFLLGRYTPNYSANGICCKNVINLLNEKGYKVSCICNAYNENYISFKEGNTNIYPIKQRFYQRMELLSNKIKNKKIGNFLKKISVFISKIQLLVMTPFWPMVSPLYMNSFYKKALELHKKERFDIVISVYTPFESLYAGYKLKKKFPEIKFIPYYLDALAGGWGPSYLSPNIVDKKLMKKEKIISKAADLIISMDSSRKYHKKNGIDFNINRVFLDVPVMIKREVPSVIKEEFYAMYAGNLSYSGRSIIPLLEIFKIICNKTNLKLYLIGECNCVDKYNEYIEKTNGKIEFLGRKQHKEVLKYEEKAKYLINIGSTNPYTIPSKIFEYMSFNKTVISTYSIENEPSKEYLKKYKNVFFIDENLPYEESANNFIEFMFFNGKNNIKKIDLEKVFYKNTPDAFEKTIRSI